MDQLELELNRTTDARVNSVVASLDVGVETAADLARLRALWSEMESVPKLLASRTEGLDVSFGGFDVRTLLRGEESSGRYSFLSLVLPPSTEIPAHGFDTGDTFWFVLSGELEVTIGGSTANLTSSAFAFAPELTTQAVANRSSGPAEVIVGYSPAGAERAYAAAHDLAQASPDSDATAYWSLFAQYGFRFTGGEALPNDARTNIQAERVDRPVETLADYEALRGVWGQLHPIPKLVQNWRDSHMIPFNGVDLGLMLSPEESRAKASVFFNGVPHEVRVPAHYQPSEEEVFIVIDGELDIKIGDQPEPLAPPGAFAFAPRFCSHTFGPVRKTGATFYTLNSPAGHDRGFELNAQGHAPERLMTLMVAHGFNFHAASQAALRDLQDRL